MPYKDTGYIAIESDIKAQLDSYREDGESWNRFFARILRFIEQNSEEEAKKEAQNKGI